jgi:cytochrome oxidase assembly protein ShyY1
MNPTTNRFFKFLSQVAAVLVLVAIFIGLGFWQLDRARDLKASLNVNTPEFVAPVELATVATPLESLEIRGINTNVAATGNYVANYKVPNQKDSKGNISDWEAAMLQVNTTDGILVLRGLWSERLKYPDIAMSTKINVTGILTPHQNDDHAINAPGVISRLDSSVLVSTTDLNLYDGFINALDESTSSGHLDRQRISFATTTNPRIPGYYWQHLSYVVIWWLMAAVVLYLPLYQRRVRT